MNRTFGLMVILTMLSGLLFAQAFVDAESGLAITGYNDVRIPADTGTALSLSDGKNGLTFPIFRLRAGYTFANRHTLSFLAAPLTVRDSFIAEKDIAFKDGVFPAGSRVESVYRFDSYRVTYRYAFINSETLYAGLGLTGKIRSADISLIGTGGIERRSDLGVVPLINFRAQYRFAKPVSVLLDGDALVTPFGRAEDALLALQYHYGDSAVFRLGYRVLEGGSDGGGNVYTFALFHYVTAGLTVEF